MFARGAWNSLALWDAFVVFEPFVGEAFFGGLPPLAILATFAICHNFAHEPESQNSSLKRSLLLSRTAFDAFI